MAMNPMALLKVKKSWDTFCRNHPRFPAFMQAVQSSGIKEGTIIEVTFPMSQLFTSDNQNTGVSASVSVLPMSIQA